MPRRGGGRRWVRIPALAIALLLQIDAASAQPVKPAAGAGNYPNVAKAAPDGYTMLLGSVGHLTFAPVVRPGLSMLHVSYKGSNPALIATIGGEVQLVIAGLATMMPHMKAGRVRGLAVTGSKRAQVAPEVPTVAESGAKGYAFDVWYGLVFTGAVRRGGRAIAHALARRGRQGARRDRGDGRRRHGVPARLELHHRAHAARQRGAGSPVRQTANSRKARITTTGRLPYVISA